LSIIYGKENDWNKDLKKEAVLFLTISILSSSFIARAQEEVQNTLEYPPLIGKDTVYQVDKGEGLYEIARKFDISYMSIALTNQISDPNRIYAGQKLILPTRTILPKKLDKGIIINIPEFRLYFFEGDDSIKVYPVCIGLPTWRTPTGEFSITHKIKNPTWYMPDAIAEKEKVKKEIVPPGPLNPLGDFWIGTDLRHTGIHSTIIPMSIGRALSHGCVRLYPEDIEVLFPLTEVGVTGEVIYEPIKLTGREDSLFLEVYPDIYEMVQDYEKEFYKKLKILNSPPDLDKDKIKIILGEKRGIPVFIGKILR
jgi:L,D-transpeptidase ErfK/SrfK